MASCFASGDCRAVGKNGMIGNVASIAEVGVHDCFVDVHLGTRPVLCLDVGEETVCGQRVRTKGDVHVERDSICCGDLGHVAQNCGRLFWSAELLGIGNRDGRRFVRRRSRVELIGPHDDFKVMRQSVGPQRLHRPFEPPFANKTPRTDEIGEDFDLHRCHDRGDGSAALGWSDLLRHARG